jgi:membrane-associated phospholipid phosphatase
MSVLLFYASSIHRFFLILYWSLVLAGLALWLAFTSPSIVLAINAHQNALLTSFLSYYTHVGDGLFCIALIVLLFFINRKTAFITLVCFLVSSGIAQLVKNYYGTVPRPANYFSIIHVPFQIPAGVTALQWQSFPSGHTVSAFVMALLLVALSKKKWLQVLWLLAAITVGFSRMYLGQHFYRDVFVGMVLGIEIASFVLYCFHRWGDRYVNNIAFFRVTIPN